MNNQDRERILYSILSGTKIFKIKNQKFVVKTPNVDVLSESNFVYDEVYKESILLGSYRKKDLKDLLIGKGFFRNDEFEFVDKFQSNLESMQKKLYKERENPLLYKSNKESIALLKQKYLNIVTKHNKFDMYTAEGIASYMKILFILKNTVYVNNKTLKYNKKIFDEVLNEYYENVITHEMIREIARNHPWANMWVGLKSNGVIFNEGVSISIDQQLLLLWSKIYDSINESPEPPTHDVINDDDMLDGWMLLQKKKEDNSKYEKFDEVFIVAKDQDEASKINEMNSEFVKQIKTQRLNYIHEKGRVHECDLPDVKLDINLKKVQLEREARNG